MDVRFHQCESDNASIEATTGDSNLDSNALTERGAEAMPRVRLGF